VGAASGMKYFVDGFVSLEVNFKEGKRFFVFVNCCQSHSCVTFSNLLKRHHTLSSFDWKSTEPIA